MHAAIIASPRTCRWQRSRAHGHASRRAIRRPPRMPAAIISKIEILLENIVVTDKRERATTSALDHRDILQRYLRTAHARGRPKSSRAIDIGPAACERAHVLA